MGLFWNGQQDNFQNNYSLVLSQLKLLERRLGKDENLKERFLETFGNYLKKGYVTKMETSEITSNTACCYLPHHLALNPNKPEKVRSVCRAASKFRGISLKDVLLIGSDLLKSLWGIFFRFRKIPVAVSADTEEMLPQVHVEVDDRNNFRLLWKKNDGQIQILRYNKCSERSHHQRLPILHFNSAQKTSKTTFQKPA